MGRLRPLFARGAGSPGPRPTPVTSGIWVHAAIWPQQIWAENWGLCPFGKADVVSAEAYLRAKFHLDPSNRLATVLHQRHRQTDRTDRTGQRSDGIGRTVLQTVAQRPRTRNTIEYLWA